MYACDPILKTHLKYWETVASHYLIKFSKSGLSRKFFSKVFSYGIVIQVSLISTSDMPNCMLIYMDHLIMLLTAHSYMLISLGY